VAVSDRPFVEGGMAASRLNRLSTPVDQRRYFKIFSI
jgi:hypothetical protein